MSITTYQGLLTRLGKLIAEDFENPGDVSVEAIQTAIEMAETRIYRELRTSYNEATFGVSDTVTGNAYTLPSGFKSVNMLHFGRYPLEPVTPEWLQSYLQCNTTGDSRYFANIGGTLHFAPAVADTTQLQGTYFKALPALSAATLPSNALFAAANDLFLSAAMVEAAPLFDMADKLPVWEAKYESVRDALNLEKRVTAMGAGRMKIRPSTTLIG